jgi:hypothetical protein
MQVIQPYVFFSRLYGCALLDGAPVAELAIVAQKGKRSKGRKKLEKGNGKFLSLSFI